MFVYIHVNKNYIRKAAREETRLRLATAQLVQFPSAGHCLRHFWGLSFYFSFVELRRLVQLVRETIIDRNALLARHIKPL
jgi:hypothetical protein